MRVHKTCIPMNIQNSQVYIGCKADPDEVTASFTLYATPCID